MVRDFSNQVQCFDTEKFSPLAFGSTIFDPPDADFAELDHTRGVMLLEQHGSLFVAGLGVGPVDDELSVYPGAQSRALGADSHREPASVRGPGGTGAGSRPEAAIDAPGGVVRIAVVDLGLVARRVLSGLVAVRLAAEVDPAVSSSSLAIPDAGLDGQFEVLELLQGRQVALAASTREDPVRPLDSGATIR